MAMAILAELSVDECIELLAAKRVGRAAICTPLGPHVVPVNYAVHGDSIVFRTAPYSILGTYGCLGDIAFEVDHVDGENHLGWSVIAVGRGEMLEDAEDIEEVRWAHHLEPWAEGPRTLFVRMRWREVTGRRLR